MRRKIVYVSGTRADFGLMRRTLCRLHSDERVELSIAVTGMHLEGRYGHTVDEIAQAELPIGLRVPNDLARSDGLSMARALAATLDGFATGFAAMKPDIVLVLGDRGEMLAGALAAVHLNIGVAHIHGGERSGTIDESIRHAISKFSHYHFTSTEGARERLIRMGENPQHVFVTGAPGLDGLGDTPPIARATLFAQAGLNPEKPACLVLFHPVVQQADQAHAQMLDVLSAALSTGLQVLCLQPNADAGADAIRSAIDVHRGAPGFSVQTHLPRQAFLSWMAHAEFMLGNSSSGLIEAATFGLPVVNVGDRQRSRERGANVVDVTADRGAIESGIAQARALRGRRFVNIYGDGRAGERITELLSTLPLDKSLMEKLNAY